MTDEAIEAWLVARIASELGLAEDDIDREEVFASFGLDSLKAVALAGELETMLGRRLPPTLLWDYPSIRKLARHLHAGDGVPPSSGAA